LVTCYRKKTHNGEKKTEEHPRRYSYRYRLHNGEGGGIFITDAATLEGARNELDAAYGDRLAVVTPA
jgi:hypothetical protein